jgi:flap endonuclease-1
VADRVAIDSSIIIYQALNSIRRRGYPLVGRKGELTSHIYLLVYRCLGYLEAGFEPIFVFETIDFPHGRSKSIFSMTPSTVTNASEVIKCLGVPVIVAGCDGEAMGSYIVKRGDADYIATMDVDDSFFFGCPVCSKSNLKVETIGKNIITMTRWLSDLGFDNLAQYRDYFILIGNDYNNKLLPRGKGKKTAIKLLKKYGKIEDIPDLDIDMGIVDSVREIARHPNVNKDYKIEFHKPQYDRLKSMLYKFKFSPKRVKNIVKRLEKLEK